MQVLPRRVVGLLFDLRPRARAARNPPHSRPFRRRHHLGLPPPELRDSHKEGIAVRNASLEASHYEDLARRLLPRYEHSPEEEGCRPKGPKRCGELPT